MLQQQVYIINTILIALDALCVIAAGYGAHYLRAYQSGFVWSMQTDVFVASVMAVMFINNFVMGQLNLYGETRQRSAISILLSVFKAIAIDFAFLATFVFILKQEDFSRLFMAYFAGLSFALIVSERLVAQIYLVRRARQGLNTRRILIIGTPDRADTVRSILDRQLSWGHQVVGCLVPEKETTVAPFGHPEQATEFESELKQKAIDEVIFAMKGDRSIGLGKYIDICRTIGIPCRILPAMWNAQDGHLSIERCQGIPFLTFRAGNFNATGLLYKRMLDILGGTVGCLLLLLMYPFVAVAIRLDSPGPVFFRQKRMGRNGRVFHLYKFRTMVTDAEERKAELVP